jgi:UDP-N-acetylmuramate dehydrogenase
MNIKISETHKSIDFSRYSSIHIGGVHDVKIINKIDKYDNHYIIGRANNLIISNTPPKLAILGKEFDYIIQQNGKLIVGASTTSGKLLIYCKKHNIKHFELLSKLPGNIGGLVKMNAGLKEYEIFNHLNSIKIQSGDIEKKDIKYGYRHTQIDGIIFEVTFDIEYGFCTDMQKLFIHMRDNQPQLPSAGSCFQNGDDYFAGKLIEDVNLKGFRIGDMGFSSQHANFLINYGAGTFDDAIKVIETAKQKIKDKFSIDLKLENIIV